MKTKLDYYRIFYETARCRSFSIAAQHLYISQSAISQCIHQLESDLNAQLFVRTRKGVSLTNEGQLLFLKVESAITSIEQGESSWIGSAIWKRVSFGLPQAIRSRPTFC